MKKLLLIILTAALYASCVKQPDPPTATAEDMTMENVVAADTPIVKITNPKNGDTVAGTITIKVKVTDNVSIDSVLCTIDGVSLGKKTTTPYNFVWDTKTVLNGTHLLIATAFDHSGRSKSKKITVSINNTAILSMEQELINLVNTERQNRGLTPYTFNSLLLLAARGHSLDMASHNFFSHAGSDGSALSTRLTRVGYPYLIAAENISGGHSTALGVFNGWMADPSQRSILISSNYKDIGVGGGYSSAKNSLYHYYWTLVVASQ